MHQTSAGLAVVTGASTGIGLSSRKICAEHGFDLLIAADEPEIEAAADELRAATAARSKPCRPISPRTEGVDRLYDAIGGRPVDALLANAGRGLGKGFLDQDFERGPPRRRHQCHRHDLSDPQGRPRHARARARAAS